MIKLKTLSKEVIDQIQLRLKDEYSAFYLYRAASNWCRETGFEKAAEYFEKESADELIHAKKLEEFLVDWNSIPVLPLVASPILNFKGLSDIIEKAYTIEYSLYVSYEASSTIIFNSGNISVFDFFGWFRDIQTKSVAEYATMINKLEGIDVNDKFQMLLLEEKLF